ncbi:hypothetical protein EDB87DRAFT_1636561 [Lactarius vividus]|nr:hypothetical protein EDB87DRAFT_1636561 [Lactarius vividus]
MEPPTPFFLDSTQIFFESTSPPRCTTETKSSPCVPNSHFPFNSPRGRHDLGVHHTLHQPDDERASNCGLLPSVTFHSIGTISLTVSGTSLSSNSAFSGTTVSITMFGLSRSFWTMVLCHFLSGALNRNIGVSKSALVELADDSNIAFSSLPVVFEVGQI